MTPFIIPAYKPNKRLITLLSELVLKTQNPIIVVDDGNQDTSIFEDPIFSSNQNIILLRHALNLGKGAALKTAFNYALTHYDNIQGCITLDADGQHGILDVMAVLSKFQKHSKHLILGVRNFSLTNDEIPLRSRVGNLLTRLIWNLMTYSKITDTQKLGYGVYQLSS